MTDITLVSRLNPPFARVVQKANIGHSFTYALQMYRGDTYVSRTRNARYDGQKLNFGNPGLKLVGRSEAQVKRGTNKNAAGGHTQTWEYAGPTGNGSWFIGTKPNDALWTTQIARVKYPGSHTRNTEMTRISELVKITQYDNWHGSHIKRVEAAVSPNYQYLLIATVWTDNTGHFGLYNLPGVNHLLNGIGNGDVSVDDLAEYQIRVVDIDNFVNRMGSIQGYDIDDYENVYVSSQYSPDHSNSEERKIVKFNLAQPDNWHPFKLTNDLRLDQNYEGYPTELEGIQVIDTDDMYLTVAYHSADGESTIGNQVFRVQLS